MSESIVKDTAFAEAVGEAHRGFLAQRLQKAMEQLFNEDIGNELNGAGLFYQVAYASHVVKEECERQFRLLCGLHLPELRTPVDNLVRHAEEWSYDYL